MKKRNLIVGAALLVVIILFTALNLPRLLRGGSISGSDGMLPTTIDFDLTSPAFMNGEAIPQKYACDGENLSPPLDWGAPPAGTHSLALIVDDPDAPGGTWVHWVLYGIPGTARGLEPGFQPGMPVEGVQVIFGKNSSGKTTYAGPCPPSGTHHYIFHLYALDFSPSLSGGVAKRDLLETIQGHVLGYAELTGTYNK
jgi:Raf kinase inhibitor-like YbhB/YbcL family protein